jgi:hypothetical protein
MAQSSIIQDLMPAGLSQTEQAQISTLVSKTGMSRNEFLLYAFRLVAQSQNFPRLTAKDQDEAGGELGEGNTTTNSTIFVEQTEKEKLLQKMELLTGRKLPRFSSREEALVSSDRAYKEARIKNQHPPMTEEEEAELMELVDIEREAVWQEQQKEKLIAQPATK